MLTRAHVSGSLNCSVRNAPETYLSWSIDSVCIFLQTVVCNPSRLFCMCSFEPCQLVDERNRDGSDRGVPPVCQVLCEPLTFCKCSLFQMCEVGDCHRFREEAVKLREGSGNLAAVIQGPHAPHVSVVHSRCPDTGSRAALSAQPVLSWLHMFCSGVQWKEQPYIRHACSQGRAGQALQGPEYSLTRGRGVAEQATYQSPSQWAGTLTSPSGRNGCQGREDESTLSEPRAQNQNLTCWDALTVSGRGWGVLLRSEEPEE